MSAGRRSLLLLLTVLGLTLASLAVIAVKPAVLGLDLQGGVEVILQGRATEEAPVNAESIDRAVEVIRNRVDSFGVSEPEIQKQGTDQIAVSLAGVDNPDRVVNDLIKPAQLKFYDYQDNLVAGDPSTSLYQVVKRAGDTRVQDPTRGTESLYAFRKDRAHTPLAGPVTVTPGVTRAEARADLLDAVRAEDPTITSLDEVDVLTVPKGLTIVSQREQLQTRDREGPLTYVIFQDRPGVTGRDISSASATRDIGQGRSGEPIVSMQFTDNGKRQFREITRQLASRGRIQGVNQSFAIVLDGELISNPTVDYQQYPLGIDPDNGAIIQGNFSAGEAQTLSSQLNSGAIPIQLDVVSQRQVSATLGKESLRSALIAGVVGLVLVLVFLIAYYRLLGLVAAFGLIIYAALFYAVVLLVPITLTLPGIAGVILTIGISSDANVVIFERVREEARSGKSAAAALQAGYRHGIKAIIDANVVTFITAVIVFLFATAGPKGFAFTLGIGVLLSLFTAVVATRAIFGVLLGSRFMKEESLLALKQGRVFNVHWVERWRIWLVISTIPVLFGLGWLAVNGLNLGLDFESGTRISTSFERPATETDLRGTLDGVGLGEAKIQSFSETVAGETVTGFQIQTEALTPDQQTELRRALDADFGINEETFGLEQVGPTFGRQIIRNAIYAIILSFIVVALYLIVRFEYKLALPAMLSVVHDVALSIGIYAVTGREVTGATVAALLTILGYSLYDVVIVFDRIRENVPLMRGQRYREIVNRSINETITRSVITSMTTLVPVLALYLFGGETLHDFSFALLVGIISGGVSSIIIAAPIASYWKERDPAEKKAQAKAERKRQARIERDSDVVDLAVLERAEATLDDQPGLPSGFVDAEPDEPREAPATAAPATGTATAVADDAPPAEDEAAYEPLDAPAGAADGTPADTAEGAPAGDDAPGEGETPARRPAPPSDRPRRHTQVQRRRRR
jgi:SecD/SecF fusion protein